MPDYCRPHPLTFDNWVTNKKKWVSQVTGNKVFYLVSFIHSWSLHYQAIVRMFSIVIFDVSVATSV